MASQEIAPVGSGGDKTSLLNDPRIRGYFFQILALAAIVGLGYWIVHNTIENLQRARLATGFGFLNGRSGFDISSHPFTAYSSDSTFAQALWVGVLNTMTVAVVGIVTATIIGFIVGIGRLSHNWLIRKLCTVYVEVFRNVPPLLVIFFWYLGVLSALPQARQSIDLPFGTYLNNRGFFLPSIVPSTGLTLAGIGLIAGIVGALLVRRWAHRRQLATGQTFPVGLTALGLIIGLPLLAFILKGFPTFDYPILGNFNLRGGTHVGPEFMSLYLALSFYTASFIAEIVRAGIRGVGKGQSEAAHALGLRAGPTTRLVVVPQAMRIIIPPLTSQYLNLTKNSSLAVAIGYPDLVAVGGTILNQTGRSIEVVAIFMIVYLSLSVLTSLFMNWFNAKMALVER
ncbi:amino acid ABC transporter permease [Phyllobacterium sp. 21LDTY02-6]|uniref:amino acid ABC transporter permease n=1 Tax=unclassified Phyllobacterium TaxID=2638441 RepID=UPI002021D7F5|nr:MULTISPECIES: amino acid ABC transporter permease [unclassified Phyllobacterium]MCO4319702.1 amino acid ABC transporter permease [Phyllobacterium sp. 21LDTY02-6]MCX8280443.1 amino acid ABC transporter permease [Phyllobacterium sp. 0TCS1.6C]MCX8295108.1 amino acid ABC transporter permease [Phyllobacterium sp. 0TCS1.6A]